MTSTPDTIVALSTPPGLGALGMIRISGSRAIDVLDEIFIGRSLVKAPSHQACLGKIKDTEGNIIDECVLTIFRGPNSFTGEDTIEISCHGSPYIIESIIDLILSKGIRLAQPGEFTQRAFLNGKLDLAQAEAVGDLIASQSAQQHRLAMHQMRGGVSDEIRQLREKLIEFASLIELENDFGEEDVQFADRSALIELVQSTMKRVDELIETFTYGKAIKEGVAVAIIGKPNVGKSTLLNALVNEERAIVSDIPGTTRDVIEDTLIIDGLLFRFIDTAGIHETDDVIESIGIERSLAQLEKAQIVLWMAEIEESAEAIVQDFHELSIRQDQKVIILLNKQDTFHTCHSYDVEEAVSTLTKRTPTLALSAKDKKQLPALKKLLTDAIAKNKFEQQSIIISHARHKQALEETKNSLSAVLQGLSNSIPSDLVAMDIRHAQLFLGEIAGQISTDDLLDSIFSNFCIGK